MPKTWHHYVYGAHYLHRLKARSAMQMSDAMTIAHADKESAMEWRRTQQNIARIQE